MVRTKVEIKRIEDKAKRHTTFTKRRQGLIKKADELCKRCDAEAAVIAFSLAGNVYAFGHPSVKAVLARYNVAKIEQCTTLVDGGGDDDDDDHDSDSEGEKTVPDVDAAVVASNEGENDEDAAEDDLKLGEMSFEELDELDLAMEQMKRKVVNRLKEIVNTV